jgi:hypothetical protein
MNDSSPGYAFIGVFQECIGIELKISYAKALDDIEKQLEESIIKAFIADGGTMEEDE